LRNERDREYNILESAKNIITEAIGVDIDSSQHILLQLEEAVNKFNEDITGQEKLLEKAERKFDNKVLEHIAQHIAIKQVELTSVLTDIQNSFNNVTSLFTKLCNVPEYTKEIQGKLHQIDEDLKVSADKLKLEPSSSSAHYLRIKFLSEK
jgi:phosphopantetheinyl transferase (holo-ACP synthase)